MDKFRTMKPSIINILLCCMLLAGCSDDTSQWLEPELRDADSVKLTLRLPGFKTGSRAASVDDCAINTLAVVFIDNEGNYLSEATVDQSQITGSGATYEVTLPIASDAAAVQLVANYEASLGADATTVGMTGDPDSRADIVFFGSATLAELQTDNPSVTLTRSVARTELTSTAPGFTVKEVKFYGAPSSGLVGSADLTAPALPAGISYSADGVEMAADGTPHYHYEAAAGKCFLIIKGTYQGTEGWYKVGYVPSDSDGEAAGDEIALLRNHRYIFTITDVNNCGWSTEEEAVASRPDNRMTTELHDDNATIYNIIACRDYLLGVSPDVKVACDGRSAEVKLVSSYPAKAGEPQYTVGLPAEANDWLTGYTQTASTSMEESATQSQCTEYTLTFAIEANDRSENPREAVVTIRSGDLMRTVRITQEGTDFKRDPTRRVMIHNLENPGDSYDYFDFVDNELQGAKEEEMRVARNNGLHFRVYNNQYYYTIPFKEGDTGEILNGSKHISLTHVGSNWEVHCTDTRNYAMWTGQIRITNRGAARNDVVTVTYDVFHRGLFHRLTGAYQIPGPDESAERTGWFYYEQVRVNVNGQDYYVLDRDMAATGNRFYSPDGVQSRGNIGSRGGYFKIADRKTDNHLIEALPPEGYIVPEAYHLQQLGITPSGDSEGTAALTVTEGALNKIYFPMSGYMEGSIHKDNNHTCLWSRTMLSGNQGFAEDSPEYGYWFMYLDVYGDNVNLGNMRLGTRSSVNADGIGVYKAMPVRCLKGPEPPVGWNIPAPADGRRRIIIKTSGAASIYMGWDSVKYPCTGGWKKIYNCGEHNFYYDIPDDATRIVGDAGNSGNNGYQFDITITPGTTTLTYTVAP